MFYKEAHILREQCKFVPHWNSKCFPNPALTPYTKPPPQEEVHGAAIG
jgi:hypothetical protein